jgi:glutamine amidotransferase
MIAIINYGSGNVEAIANIYNKLNIPNFITHDENIINKASKIILPGVGAFDEVMSSLNNSGLVPILNRKVLEEKTPVLGICVGMQILAKSSEEGKLAGLGWVDAEVKRMDTKNLVSKPHLPHMGWNQANPTIDHPLTQNINIYKGFYFLHSYYVQCGDVKNTLMTTEYGETFTSAIYNKNIFGTQFHPEKSHQNGITIFENFANLSRW